MDYYDRYKEFRENGFVPNPMPFIKISEDTNDIRLVYDKRTMRMDSLSYKYYGDPNYAWLILNANPEVTPYEYLIEDGTPIRVPYPLSSAIDRYEMGVRKYIDSH